jgi:hypothetical protein
MYQKAVTISPGETLVISWEQNWSNLSIHKQGVLIGSVKEKADLKVGRQFSLPDGRIFMVLVSDYGLEVWHNGVELVSGTQTGAVDGFGSAFKALISVGSIQLTGSIIFMSGTGFAGGVFLSIIGGILIGLGLWARNSGSKSPFWIGIALCLLNILLDILAASIFGLVLSGILLYYLYRGTKSVPPQPTVKKSINENTPLDSDL